MPTPEEIFASFSAALKSCQNISSESDPPNGTTFKAEHTVGSCYTLYNAIDSEVLAALPKEAHDALPSLPKDKTLLFLETPADCHVRCFVKMLELNPKVGCWVLLEAKVDPGEYRHSPSGKSGKRFQEMLAIIAAYATHIDRDAWQRFIEQSTKPI